MTYSLRNLMWSVVVMCLGTALVVKVFESRRYLSYTSFSRFEKEERAQLRALHWELNHCLGKGNWRLERDHSGALEVKRSSGADNGEGGKGEGG